QPGRPVAILGKRARPRRAAPAGCRGPLRRRPARGRAAPAASRHAVFRGATAPGGGGADGGPRAAAQAGAGAADLAGAPLRRALVVRADPDARGAGLPAGPSQRPRRGPRRGDPVRQEAAALMAALAASGTGIGGAAPSRLGLEDLRVTEGKLLPGMGGVLRIEEPKVRAVARGPTGPVAELRFTYLGPTSPEEPPSS